MEHNSDFIQALSVCEESLQRNELSYDECAEVLSEMSCYRKVVDVFLLCCIRESLLPGVEFSKDTELAARGSALGYYYVDDEILRLTVINTLQYYGWVIPSDLQYDSRENSISKLAEWFQPISLSFVKEFRSDIWGEYEEAESIDHVYDMTFIRTITNDKISQIALYGRSTKTSKKAKEDISALLSKAEIILHRLYMSMMSAVTTLWNDNSLYFMHVAYIDMDDDGYIDYDINLDKHLSPSLVFRVKNLDDLANHIIKKYNIKITVNQPAAL